MYQLIIDVNKLTMGTLGLIAECYDIDLEGLEPWDETNVDKLIEVLEKDTQKYNNKIKKQGHI